MEFNRTLLKQMVEEEVRATIKDETFDTLFNIILYDFTQDSPMLTLKYAVCAEYYLMKMKYVKADRYHKMAMDEYDKQFPDTMKRRRR